MHRVLAEERGGRRMRRFVVDCPRGRSVDLTDCGRCPDCRGYTLRSAGGSTIVCSLAIDEVPRGAAPGSVGAAMVRDVACVAGELPLAGALDLLEEQRPRGLPVIDEADRPLGVLTWPDVLGAMRARGFAVPATIDGTAPRALERAWIPEAVRQVPVREIVARGAATATETEVLDAARARVRAERNQLLIVVDSEGRIIGAVPS
ncbi:MAG: CBS domain-containing protein [Deltaproteobacteria bacterium]|nr:CBS domain-containing protein [Deltaproteobacteria bacterium]